jgi:uncharacterized protein YrrD
MLRSIKQLYGNKLGATDGEIGHVKDFYFDDQNWAIRYLIVGTGTWLPGRQVLLSPYSLGRLDQVEKVLRVNLTRKQIENSPSIDLHKPVSRQYEEEYYRYFGWPYYWQGEALWGLSGFPILESAGQSLQYESALASSPATVPADAHLRSTQAVNGYQVRTGEDMIGHVCDFMMDAGSWKIGQLAVKTGHRLSGIEKLITTKEVDRISYEESTVFATLTKEVVVPSSTPDSATIVASP